MSLRALPARLYFIECDTCAVQTLGYAMPVEAEVRAAEGGWRTGRNPLTHICPWCVAKTSTSASVAASFHATETTAGR